MLLSAGPVDAQERHGEVSREWARFDVFFGGGVNFVEDLGTPVTLDAGVTGWLWESWGGTWGAGGWFFAMPEANQGSLVLALRRGYSVGRRGHFQLGVGGVQARFGGEVEDRVSTGPYLEIMAGSGSRQAAWSMGWRMGRGVGGQFVVLARLFVG
ncbi:MAG: hypothetical protein OXG35_16430 [Acidobacteria bacterium]|nr:hypothetical protein [Acidobacteriota bacterium]